MLDSSTFRSALLRHDFDDLRKAPGNSFLVARQDQNLRTEIRGLFHANSPNAPLPDFNKDPLTCIEDFDPDEDTVVVLLEQDVSRRDVTITHYGLDVIIYVQNEPTAKIVGASAAFDAETHMHVLPYQERQELLSPLPPPIDDRDAELIEYDEAEEALIILYEYGARPPVVTVTSSGSGVYTVFADGHPMIITATKGPEVTASDIFLLERNKDGSVPVFAQ
jgi:hypothetical protein